MTYEVFPFGKYKGVLLSEIPSTYLVYALETFDLPDELTLEMFLVLICKLGYSTGMSDQNVLKSNYRKCAKIYHPDNGGSDKEMAAITFFYELLKTGK